MTETYIETYSVVVLNHMTHLGIKRPFHGNSLRPPEKQMPILLFIREAKLVIKWQRLGLPQHEELF